VRDFSGPREFFHQGPSDVAKYQEKQHYCDWVQTAGPTDLHQDTYGGADRNGGQQKANDQISGVSWFFVIVPVPHTAPHLSEFRLFAHAATVPLISIV
jgi:hypothetical protein